MSFSKTFSPPYVDHDNPFNIVACSCGVAAKKSAVKKEGNHLAWPCPPLFFPKNATTWKFSVLYIFPLQDLTEAGSSTPALSSMMTVRSVASLSGLTPVVEWTSHQITHSLRTQRVLFVTVTWLQENRLSEKKVCIHWKPFKNNSDSSKN